MLMTTKLGMVATYQEWLQLIRPHCCIRLDLKNLFVCRHPTQGFKVGSVGRDFFILVVSLVPILVVSHFLCLWEYVARGNY